MTRTFLLGKERHSNCPVQTGLGMTAPSPPTAKSPQPKEFKICQVRGDKVQPFDPHSYGTKDHSPGSDTVAHNCLFNFIDHCQIKRQSSAPSSTGLERCTTASSMKLELLSHHPCWKRGQEHSQCNLQISSAIFIGENGPSKSLERELYLRLWLLRGTLYAPATGDKSKLNISLFSKTCSGSWKKKAKHKTPWMSAVRKGLSCEPERSPEQGTWGWGLSLAYLVNLNVIQFCWF